MTFFINSFTNEVEELDYFEGNGVMEGICIREAAFYKGIVEGGVFG